MIDSPYLAGRDRYERGLEGWVDNTHHDAFTYTVRLVDDDYAVELSAVCTLSPDYQVREARARVLEGPADPALAGALNGLAGARMVGGFTRRVAELAADRCGAPLLVDAAVEVARLARQVTKMPRDSVAAVRQGDAPACWQLDTRAWADLPNSCFTYSEAGRALLDSRPGVMAMATPELYDPAPGATRVFVRRRRSRLLLTPPRLDLFQSMHDNIHGFDVHYQLDLDSATIVAADSITSR